MLCRPYVKIISRDDTARARAYCAPFFVAHFNRHDSLFLSVGVRTLFIQSLMHSGLKSLQSYCIQ